MGSEMCIRDRLLTPLVTASAQLEPIAVLSFPVVFCNTLDPTPVFLVPVDTVFKTSYPTAVFLSPEVIAVPALYPIKVFFSASVPVKLSPAFVPAKVLYCASLDTPVAIAAHELSPLK